MLEQDKPSFIGATARDYILEFSRRFNIADVVVEQHEATDLPLNGNYNVTIRFESASQMSVILVPKANMFDNGPDDFSVYYFDTQAVSFEAFSASLGEFLGLVAPEPHCQPSFDDVEIEDYFDLGYILEARAHIW